MARGCFLCGCGWCFVLGFFSVTNDVRFTDEEGLGGWKKLMLDLELSPCQICRGEIPPEKCSRSYTSFQNSICLFCVRSPSWPAGEPPKHKVPFGKWNTRRSIPPNSPRHVLSAMEPEEAGNGGRRRKEKFVPLVDKSPQLLEESLRLRHLWEENENRELHGGWEIALAICSKSFRIEGLDDSGESFFLLCRTFFVFFSPRRLLSSLLPLTPSQTSALAFTFLSLKSRPRHFAADDTAGDEKEKYLQILDESSKEGRSESLDTDFLCFSYTTNSFSSFSALNWYTLVWQTFFFLSWFSLAGNNTTQKRKRFFFCPFRYVLESTIEWSRKRGGGGAAGLDNLLPSPSTSRHPSTHRVCHHPTRLISIFLLW